MDDGTRPPAERHESIRRAMAEFLRSTPRGVREISRRLGIPEKAVAEHLEHLRRSRRGREEKLEVTPATCLDCGFVFRKRERLRVPGRCPLCRSANRGIARVRIQSAGLDLRAADAQSRMSVALLFGTDPATDDCVTAAGLPCSGGASAARCKSPQV